MYPIGCVNIFILRLSKLEIHKELVDNTRGNDMRKSIVFIQRSAVRKTQGQGKLLASKHCDELQTQKQKRSSTLTTRGQRTLDSKNPRAQILAGSMRVAGSKVVIPPSVVTTNGKISQTLKSVDHAERPTLAALFGDGPGF